MIVKQLIEELSKLDQDKEVCIATTSGAAVEPKRISFDEYIKCYVIKSYNSSRG